MRVIRTKSRVDGGLGAVRFSDHDGCVGVVLLHGGVASGEKVPTLSCQQMVLMQIHECICL
jgi:hypothetical protein